MIPLDHLHKHLADPLNVRAELIDVRTGEALSIPISVELDGLSAARIQVDVCRAISGASTVRLSEFGPEQEEIERITVTDAEGQTIALGQIRYDSA